MKRVGRSIKASNDGEEKRERETCRPPAFSYRTIHNVYINRRVYYICIHRRRRCHFSQTERANVVIKRLRYYNEKEGGKKKKK